MALTKVHNRMIAATICQTVFTQEAKDAYAAHLASQQEGM